jgi:hypothetical protein
MPAAIFSVLQKRIERYSDLCLAWSGIALHGGRSPGKPPFHSCVQKAVASAARPLDATRRGVRVIVAQDDVAPFEITHPSWLPSKSEASNLAATRAAQAVEMANKAQQARLAAVAASREAAPLRVPARMAEILKLRAESQLVAAEASVAFAISAEARVQAEEAKTKVLDRIAELQAKWVAAKADLQPKLDAVAAARAAAASAEVMRVAAAQAAQAAARNLEPISIFISRRSQRLYVWQASQPIWESPVTFLDADRPVGTHVFMAVEQTSGNTGMRWNAVTLDDGRPRASVTEPRGWARGRSGQAVEPVSMDPDSAKTALDRIVIQKGTLDRIAELLSPRSSLVISDEALSGNDTEFVVTLSSEQQGSVRSRRRGSGI